MAHIPNASHFETLFNLSTSMGTILRLMKKPEGLTRIQAGGGAMAALDHLHVFYRAFGTL